MKKLSAILAVLVLLGALSPFSALAYDFDLTGYTLNAKASYVVNTDTGRVIANNNGEEKRSIASLTKIMTAVCVLENCGSLRQTVTAKQALLDEIGKTGLVNVGLKSGETLRVKDLLHCLLLPSAADAALVLADYIGGSVDAFVAMMNEKAAALGMTDTHYVDPHGLHERAENHYSTAKDQATLCAYAMQNTAFAKIVSTAKYVVPATNLSGKRAISATNRLLAADDPYQYEYATGIKTGFTNDAGRCLATAASDGQTHYVCVVLGCEAYRADGRGGVRQFMDSIFLLENAFAAYTMQDAFGDGEVLAAIHDKCFGIDTDVALIPEEPFSWLLKTGESFSLEQNLFANRLSAPVEKGEALGTCVISVGGQPIGTVRLVAAETVKRSPTRMAGTVLLFLLVALAVLLLAAKISRTISKARKRAARRRRAQAGRNGAPRAR